MNLPALLRKAVGDAGFDLSFDSDGEWQRVGVSGSANVAWILPSGAGAMFAVADQAVFSEFDRTTWTEVPIPSGAAGAVRCRTAEELHRALSRTRVLFAQLPPAPQQRFAQRLNAIGSTEVEVLVKQRVGQELFREMLMEYWGGRCALTGLDVPELLRASHAKPWKDCDDLERLDVYNGLLLGVHLDRCKLSQPSIPQGVFEQIACPPPRAVAAELRAGIIQRVIQLTYVAEDMRPFATELGHNGLPFDWNAQRATTRAELDVIVAWLYGLSREELAYILDPADVQPADHPSETFRVLKSNEEREFGEYRTRRLVLEAWDRLHQHRNPRSEILLQH